MIALPVTLALLPACTGGSTATPSQPPTPTRPPTTTVSSCLALTEATGDGGRIVRYDAPAGSSWWVTYGVFQNSCPAPLILEGISQAGPRHGDETTWTGRAAATVPPEIPDALWPADTPRPTSPLTVYQVPPGARVHVAAEVRQLPGGQPHRVPALTIRFGDGHGRSARLVAHPDVSLCGCPLPG